MKTRLIALLVAVGVALSGVGASLGAHAQSAQAASAPVTVTMFAAPSSDVQNLDTNWFTKYVEKQYNLKIRWSIATSSDAATKQQLLLASGNYPDMFWAGSFSNSDLLKYGHQGVLVPLN